MKIVSSKTLIALTFSMMMFAGCAGSKAGVDGGSADGGAGGADGAAPKVSASALDAASKEAMNLENDNHELRREIFEAKNQLGIANDVGTDD